MASFLANAGTELQARRRRMRASLGDRGASLAEFVFLCAPVAGLFAPILAPGGFAAIAWAPFVPALVLVGYFSLEARRQRAERSEEGNGAAQARFDRLTLLLLSAGAIAGVAALTLALTMPGPTVGDPLRPPDVVVPTEIVPAN